MKKKLIRAAIEPLEVRRLLAGLVVNSVADDTTPGNNLVTLREAITAANNDTTTDTGQTSSGADTINFNLGAGAHVIILGAALNLSKNLDIIGPGADLLTVSGGNVD